jgi:hypothetical protein
MQLLLLLRFLCHTIEKVCTLLDPGNTVGCILQNVIGMTNVTYALESNILTNTDHVNDDLD